MLRKRLKRFRKPTNAIFAVIGLLLIWMLPRLAITHAEDEVKTPLLGRMT